ncbi:MULTISPECIES: hypothetical protein [unclassified Crossiella]|uniref:hypothetical protein n=1 Tax=unclassified Crossiella TaxID=2620835 RepID=UPI001FFF215B|nr:MULTISPECIES: hypothetical protein [unclassified Crossiella]MCK2240953.1 hypothetical protein [Crossiella sp. S99.2]MCK2253903.1 hypothetical protein [Crossiella sp. S99.1]
MTPHPEPASGARWQRHAETIARGHVRRAYHVLIAKTWCAFLPFALTATAGVGLVWNVWLLLHQLPVRAWVLTGEAVLIGAVVCALALRRFRRRPGWLALVVAAPSALAWGGLLVRGWFWPTALLAVTATVAALCFTWPAAVQATRDIAVLWRWRPPAAHRRPLRGPARHRREGSP